MNKKHILDDFPIQQPDLATGYINKHIRAFTAYTLLVIRNVM